MTGGRIVLTDDALAIETKHLGFAVSPHEECGVEEAVRIVEAHGGESVVLTLGVAEAEEQLRDAMAIGIDRGILLQTDGEEWDPEATAGAIVDAIRADEAASGPFDLIFFGNESADSGGFQIGLRAAYALGRPCATGLKGVAVEGASVRCEQEFGGGRDVYELPLPAVVTVLEGLNLPRYPVRAGADARRAQAARGLAAGAAGVAARARPGSSSRRARRGRPRCSATGPTRRPPSSICSSDRGGVVNLVLVEHADGAADRRLAAGAHAGGVARGEVDALLIGPGAAEAAARRAGRRRARRRARRRSTRSRPTPGRRSSVGSPSGSGQPRSSRPGTGARDRRDGARRRRGSASRSPQTSPP